MDIFIAKPGRISKRMERKALNEEPRMEAQTCIIVGPSGKRPISCYVGPKNPRKLGLCGGFSRDPVQSTVIPSLALKRRATMAATASSFLARRLLLTRRVLSSPLRPFSTTDSSSSSSSSSSSDDSRAGSDAGPDPEQQQPPPAGQDQQAAARPRAGDTRPLENGLDPGIYKVGTP